MKRVPALVCLALLAACGDGGDGPTAPQKETETVDVSGGTVTAASGEVTLSIPGGALSQTTTITVEPAPAPPARPGLVAGTAYDFGPDGLQFAQPVQLSLGYDPQNLPSGAFEAGLAIHKQVGSDWVLVPGGSVDAGADKVRAPINSFSVYAIIFLDTPDEVVMGGDAQTATVGQAVPVRPSVVVRNAAGAALPGVAVEFRVVQGGGTVTGASQTTDAQGRATVGSWTLGSVPGVNVLEALVTGLSTPVRFEATAVAGAAAAVEKVDGDGQESAVGATVPLDPAVRVTDAFGNPVEGVTVTFTADRGGSASPPTVSTGADGVASTAWTLGDAGANTLTATVAGLASVTFSATAVDPCARAASHTWGSSVSGTLTATAGECVKFSRYVDWFEVSETQQSQRTLTLASSDFSPFVGAFAPGAAYQVSGRSGTGSVTTHAIVGAGSYWLFATSAATGNATDGYPTGSYTLSTGTFSGDPLNACGAWYSVWGSATVQGQIDAGDCVDAFAPDAGSVTHYLEGYSVYLAAGQTVEVTLVGNLELTLSYWFGNQHVAAKNTPANVPTSYTVTATQSGFYLFHPIGAQHQATGSFTMTFSRSGGSTLRAGEAQSTPLLMQPAR